MVESLTTKLTGIKTKRYISSKTVLINEKEKILLFNAISLIHYFRDKLFRLMVYVRV